MLELFGGFVLTVIILIIAIGTFFIFDNEVLYGHFAKKVRKYFVVE